MLLWTLIIFGARIVDVSLGTIRVHFIVRQKKAMATMIGFVEVLIFILIVSRVIQDIQHWSYVVAYAGGFATGTMLGMHLAGKLSKQVLQVTVISDGQSSEVEAALREAGFALTRLVGTGRDGVVNVLDVVCAAKGLDRLTAAVAAVDPQAFVYSQELAGLRGGHVYGIKSKV